MNIYDISEKAGVSIATVKNIETYHGEGGGYKMQNYDHVVPTLRFSAGVEWFIMPNFGVFAETAYTQHLLPTIIEPAAMDRKEIKHPSGPLTFSIGLSLFFN